MPNATLLDSFFDAMVRLDGDRLVMQVGQKPYVVRASSTYRGPAEWGQVELSTRPLTLETALSMLEQILPPEQWTALSEIGAIEHELAPQGRPGERFTIVAARGGDDVWVEVKRRSAGAPEGSPPEEPENLNTLLSSAEYAAADAEQPHVGAIADDAGVAEQPVVRAAEVPAAAAPAATTTSGPETTGEVPRVLRAAVDAAASSVHIVPGVPPMIRQNREMRRLDAAPVTAADIERFLRAANIPAEAAWDGELPDVGRVRCVPVADRRGRGLTVQVVSPSLLTADHLGLPEAVQSLTAEADGLVLVAGARGSGKSTLVHALIDIINRTRCDYVIAFETAAAHLHDPQHSFISQRELEGEGEAAAAAVRQALREGPDVLVLDDLRVPETGALAIDAARAGRLVIATIAAPSAEAAVERLLDGFAPSRRQQVRVLLSSVLRGVIVQTLVRSAAGPLVAARETRLRTGASETLHDALLQLVRDGRVQPLDALRAAQDREALAAALRREGFDTEGERVG